MSSPPPETLRLEIRAGDALDVEGYEALVIPANRQLSLGWGSHLAERVARLAGPEVERELLARHPGGIALGEAVEGPAGALGAFRRLIHAAVLDKYDFNPLFLLRLRHRTSVETLRAATLAALRCGAARDGLVFTPMGAGIGGMSDRLCARTMLGALREAGRGRVLVACGRPRTAEAFLAELARLDSPG